MEPRRSQALFTSVKVATMEGMVERLSLWEWVHGIKAVHITVDQKAQNMIQSGDQASSSKTDSLSPH